MKAKPATTDANQVDEVAWPETELDQGAGGDGTGGEAEHWSLAGGDGGQPFRPGGCSVDYVGGQGAAGQPGSDAHQDATAEQGADVVHVQQQQTAQQEQAEAGDRGEPAAQMIG
jgi:hypothetical protein